MAIEDRNLVSGTQLFGSYKKEVYVCDVVEEEGGKLAFVLADGRRYKSPSSAAGALMGGKSVNGWLFWSLHAPSLSAIQSDPLPSKASRVIYRQPNQRGLERGTTRYWCNACMKGFITDQSEDLACPEGHINEPAIG